MYVGPINCINANASHTAPQSILDHLQASLVAVRFVLKNSTLCLVVSHLIVHNLTFMRRAVNCDALELVVGHDVASDGVVGGHVLCNAHQILHDMPQPSELGLLYSSACHASPAGNGDVMATHIVLD